MQATDLLKRQHREVKGLFRAVRKAHDAEEDIFYPALKDIGAEMKDAFAGEVAKH